MSSFGGSTTENGAAADFTLQEAPRGEDGPDFGTLKKAFEDTVTSVSPFCDQCNSNFRVRYALWDNQSSDGKKHARAGSGQPDPTPWDGASDLRVFLADEAINGKVALYSNAFRRANVSATPIESGDWAKAATASNFMRWLIHTQVPNTAREEKLLGNYIQEKGVGAMGVFWENRQEKTLTTVTIDEIAQAFPQLNMAELIFADEAADQLCAIFEEVYGCTKAKAKKMLRTLRTTGSATVATVGRTVSRPVIRAFNLDEELFIADSATDLESAPGVYRVQYFSPEQLRGFAYTDGWDKDWVEQAIEKCRGQYLAIAQNQYTDPQNRSFNYIQQRMTNLIGVVYAYQRLSDEDGVPGIYCTIFSPHLPPNEAQPGYAKHGLLGYKHGQYPFILFRREYLSRKLHDSRGVPEPAQPWQQQLKAHYDSRIDAASMAILPPMGYPAGRPPGRWGAGARVPVRRRDDYFFMDRPAADPITERSQELLQLSFDRYFGRSTREADPFAIGKNQDEVEGYLEQWSDVYKQVYALYDQFGSEEVKFRVIGSKREAPEVFQKDGSEYDWVLHFDIQNQDLEQMSLKWEAVLKGIQLLNREGNVNFAHTLQKYIESIDPNLAEAILEPVEVGRQKVIEEEQNDLTQIFAGVPKPIRIGTPPELAMEVIKQYMTAPDVQQRFQQDESFRERLETRVKQYQMQQMQEQNKLVGIYGALQPGQMQ